MPRKIEHRIGTDGVEQKWCLRCQQWKPLAEYSKNTSVWDGLRWQCKACEAEYRATHKEETKQYNATHVWQCRAIGTNQRAKKVGATGKLTEEELETLWESNHGVCVCCGKEMLLRGERGHPDSVTADTTVLYKAITHCKRMAAAGETPAAIRFSFDGQTHELRETVTP